MSVASATATITEPARPLARFNSWWRSLDAAERRRRVETDRKLFGSVPFESGLSDAFRAGQYAKREGEQ
jgi:hypothetical protein